MSGEVTMLHRALLLGVLVLFGVSLLGEDAKKIVTVVVATPLGAIEVALDPAHAPATVANFLRYVNGGFYDGGRFHRTVTPDNQPTNKVKIEVVQGGMNPAREKEEFPPIALERTSVTDLKHVDGTISMARAEPDTATSDFFICVGDQPELDFGGKRNPDGQGFAAFGRVVKGMDVVRKIQHSPAQGQSLTPPVPILSIKIKS
jgi:peptidyl-prolyl cis-trans isomerase A (cyclophilin A)